MRTGWSTYPVEFKGGLIQNLSTLQQGINAPGSATILRNFEPSIEGGYKKVLGYSKWNAFAVPGTGQVQCAILSDDRDVITVRNSKYYLSVDTTNWVEKLDLSASPGGKVRHDNFNFNGTAKIVMVDGLNDPVYYEATTNTITADTTAPADVTGASYVAVFKNHIFFAKGSLLTFTSPYLETDFLPANGAGVINIGSTITGLVVFREQLIIFSVDKIDRLAGNSQADFILQPITTKTGCLSGDTIQEVGGDILYLGPDGVRFLSATERIGDFALERASEPIQRNLTTTIMGGESYSSYVIRNKSQYRIFRFDDDTTADLTKGFLATRSIDRDSAGIAWAELLGIKVYNADSRQFTDGETIIFCSDTAYIYQAESGSDFDGANISCRFKTPSFPIQDPRIRKTFYKSTLYMTANGVIDILCQPTLDYDEQGVLQPPTLTLVGNGGGVYYWGVGAGGATRTIWGQFNYGDVIDTTYNNNLIGSGFVISFDFVETSTLPSFNIDTLIIEYRQNDRK